MKKWIVRLVLGLVVLAVALAVAVFAIIKRQGLSPEQTTAALSDVHVRFDAHGVPTIEADDWQKIVRAQGFVVASERLFQMDLMRRAAAGRLGELFGEAALAHDTKRRQEDWEGVARRAVSELEPKERAFLEQYAAGVNAFIEGQRWRWGLEYLLVGIEPEPWKPSDSLLVLLSMCERLAVAAESEAEREAWRRGLSPAWFDYLFPDDHPWNEPMFGTKEKTGPAFPAAQALPKSPLAAAEKSWLEEAPTLADLRERSAKFGASNSWAWCGRSGCYLANDPHLGGSVPQLWYAARLRRTHDEWVVGLALPGLPGVVLGMNAHLAWAFTNVGEDVDDYLEETISEDGLRYLHSRVEGSERWEPIIVKTSTIVLKDGRRIVVRGRHTHRGPLGKRPNLDPSAEYSRQWLPLKPGMLRFPVELNFARSWEEMNAALDGMRAPAQNVLVVDRKGNIGYRASGTGVRRRVSGRRPQPALDGEWIDLLPASTRPRLWFYVRGSDGDSGAGATATVAPTQSRFLATANERIWVDEYGHRWGDDRRKERIRRALSERDDFVAEDMRQLQLDTESRYHQLVARWVATHAEPTDPPEQALANRFREWDGVAARDPETFSRAIVAERGLVRLCIDRVRARYFAAGQRGLRYRARLETAWVIDALTEGGPGLAAFGLDDGEVAGALLARAARFHGPTYEVENRSAVQHPFASRVPVLGDLFRIDAPAQRGFLGVVRVESPTFGASTRLVWVLSDPSQSTWSLPVGQSGHLGSPHYADDQAGFVAGVSRQAFDPAWK